MARDYALYGPIGVTYASETGTRDAVISGAYLSETSGGAAYSLTCAAGACTFTGQAAALRAARRITAARGAFALLGAPTGGATSRSIAIAAGIFSFTLASTQAALRSDPAAFIVVGNASALLYTPVSTKIIAETGIFAVRGFDIDPIWNLPFNAAAGAIVLAGGVAGLAVGNKTLPAGVGAFSLTGLPTGNGLAADVGAFALTGATATLTLNADTFWRRIEDTAEIWTRVSI